MPFSHSGQISAIVSEVESLNPDSILDVGVGMGQYGFLLRTNLENINLFTINGAVARRAPREAWRVRIEGVEGFPEYLTPVHDYAYNKIHIGNALDVLPTLPEASFDLVIAIDILEHVTTEDGLGFLRMLKRVSRKHVLVSTPKDFIHQEVEANPLEDHLSVWSCDDLTQAGFDRVVPNEVSWINIHTR